MSQLRTDILIALKADTSGAAAARASLLGIQGAASQVNSLLALGGLTVGAAGLVSFVRRGVEFNSTLESSQIGIAALLRQFQPEKFASFSDAMKEAARAVALLREEAKTSPATFQQLLGAFQSTTGAMQRAGVPIERQVKLISTMSQALSALGIRSEQITQESRALITGNITEDAAAARILGITKADITRATEAGKLVEFLEDRLSAFAEAGRNAQESFAVLASGLSDQLDDLASRFAGPLTTALKAGAKDLAEAFKSISDEDLKGIAEAMASAANGAILLAKGLIAAAPAAKEIALAAGALLISQKAFRASQTVGASVEAIIAARADASALSRRAGPDPRLFDEFSAGLRNSVTSLSGFATALANIGAIGGAAVIGFQLGTAVDKFTGFSDKFAADWDRMFGESGRTTGRQTADEIRVGEIRDALRTAVVAGDLEAFDLAAEKLRAFSAAIAPWARDETFANAARGAKSLTEGLDAMSAQLESNAKSLSSSFRLSLIRSVNASEATPLTTAQNAARSSLFKAGRNFSGFKDDSIAPDDQLAARLDARIAELRKFLLGASANPANRPGAPGFDAFKATTDAASGALADLVKSRDALKKETESDPLKKRADETAEATRKLEETLRSLGETAGQTATRHLEEARKALALTTPGSLENINAQQALVDAQKAARSSGADKGLSLFGAGDFAGDTARFGAFNFDPRSLLTGPQGLPPNVQATAEKTAQATAESAASLKELLRLANTNGRLTFSTR